MTRERIDLTSRRGLLQSWLATLHGSELGLVPLVSGPAAPLGTLLRTAAAWHAAYLLLALPGAFAV